MDFDDADLASLQIEDLGEYFFANDAENGPAGNWKGCSLEYVDDQVAEGRGAAHAATTMTMPKNHGNANTGSVLAPGSPPLTSLSELLKSFGAPTMETSSRGTSPPPLMSWMGIENGNANGNGIGIGPMTTTGKKRMRQAEDADELMALAHFSLEAPTSTTTSSLSLPPTTSSVHMSMSMSMPSTTPRMTPRTLGTPDRSSAGAREDEHEHEQDQDADDDSDLDEEPAKKWRKVQSSPTSAAELARAQRCTCSNGREDPRKECCMQHCPVLAAAVDVAIDADRGVRKKSREKMRRQEVNCKFDELVDLLGLSSRVRKCAVLQEAASTIKTLRRERDEMQIERDRLRQEVAKLAACLHFSQLSSMAAASAVAMSQSSSQPNQAARATMDISQLTTAAAEATNAFPSLFSLGGKEPAILTTGETQVSAHIASEPRIAPKTTKTS